MKDIINRLHSGFQNRVATPHSHRTSLNSKTRIQIRDDIINLSMEIKNVYPHFSSELFRLKDVLYVVQGIHYFFHPEAFNQVFAIVKALKYDIDNGIDLGIWAFMHPIIINTSKQLFVDKHYANAVQAAVVEINSRVKKIRIGIDGKELDGVKLMQQTFNVSNPILTFEDNSTDSGKNVQQGYMDIFAGVMKGIRNPNAHENLTMSNEDATRKLIFASLLMYKVDDAVAFNRIIE